MRGQKKESERQKKKKDLVLTTCAHVFCKNCITEALNTNNTWLSHANNYSIATQPVSTFAPNLLLSHPTTFYRRVMTCRLTPGQLDPPAHLPSHAIRAKLLQHLGRLFGPTGVDLLSSRESERPETGSFQRVRRRKVSCFRLQKDPCDRIGVRVGRARKGTAMLSALYPQCLVAPD